MCYSNALKGQVALVTSKQKQLTASMEDYLEAILYLVRRKQVARVRDIADRVGVGMSSVSTALKSLAKRELVNYDPYEAITLTTRGWEVAEGVSQRHHLLRRFLTDVLGLDSETADANACRMEHAVDDALLDRLMHFSVFIRTCPRAGRPWIENFMQTCGEGIDRARCAQCVSDIISTSAASAEAVGQESGK